MADDFNEEELRLRALARQRAEKKGVSWSDVITQAPIKAAAGVADTIANTPSNLGNLLKAGNELFQAGLASESYNPSDASEVTIPDNTVTNYLSGQGMIDPNMRENMTPGQKITDTGIQGATGALFGGSANAARQALVGGTSAALGQGVTEATGSEGAGLLTSLLSPLAGSKIAALNQARDRARALNQPRDDTLRRARDLNFVVVPEHGILDFLDRPEALRQAAAINQHRTNEVARKYVGLGDNEGITVDKLKGIRKKVYDTTYEPIKKIGNMIFDPDYVTDLNNIAKEFSGQSNTFPKAVSAGLKDLVDRYRVSTGTTEDVIDKIRTLRERATKYINSDIPDNEEFGFAQQKIADAMEDALEREIGRKGWPITMMDNYREGRKTIARTFSVQSALNRGSGDVSGKKLAKLLEKDIPIDGDLRTVAQFNLINKPRASNNADLVKVGFAHAAGISGGFAAAQALELPAYAGPLMAMAGAAAIGGARSALAKPAIAATLSKRGQESIAPNYDSLGIDPRSGALGGLMFENAQGAQ